MDFFDKLFATGIVVLIVLQVAFWAAGAYVAYRVLTHFGIV